MKIMIQTISHNEQRYETVGDWQFTQVAIPLVEPIDALLINVSDLGDEKMNCLIAIHELVEALLCRFHEPEITGKEVDEFDFHASEAGIEEPGEDERAPYHNQHRIATRFEQFLCQELNVDWKEYEKKIDSL
jgi:hypothetical protein